MLSKYYEPPKYNIHSLNPASLMYKLTIIVNFINHSDIVSDHTSCLEKIFEYIDNYSIKVSPEDIEFVNKELERSIIVGNGTLKWLNKILTFESLKKILVNHGKPSKM